MDPTQNALGSQTLCILLVCSSESITTRLQVSGTTMINRYSATLNSTESCRTNEFQEHRGRYDKDVFVLIGTESNPKVYLLSEVRGLPFSLYSQIHPGAVCR